MVSVFTSYDISSLSKYHRNVVQDGNAFYRAFIFGIFEYYALNLPIKDIKKDFNAKNYDKLIDQIFQSRIQMYTYTNLSHDQIDSTY